MAIRALHSAATGLNALTTALDVIANNIANANTDGFKASRANFQDLLYEEVAQPGVENANGDQRPTGLYIGLGVKVSGTQLDFRQGAARPTERELDLMIEGEGFFPVGISDDVGDGVGYTRAGNFELNSDGEIVLANDHGYRLEPSITVPEEAIGLSILPTGEVYASIRNQTDPELIGEIEVATFVNPAGLKQVGENIFVPSAASGDPNAGLPNEDGRGLVRQGFLEGSNVDPTIELVNLIKTQRSFELNSQSIQAADEALRTIGNLRRF